MLPGSCMCACLCVCACGRVCACVCVNLVVISCAEEDVVGGRVPFDEADSAAVTLQLLPWYRQVLQYTMRRDLPHFHLHTHTHIKKTKSVYADNTCKVL